jgi:hypothetical protein
VNIFHFGHLLDSCRALLLAWRVTCYGLIKWHRSLYADVRNAGGTGARAQILERSPGMSVPLLQARTSMVDGFPYKEEVGGSSPSVPTKVLELRTRIGFPESGDPISQWVSLISDFGMPDLRFKI